MLAGGACSAGQTGAKGSVRALQLDLGSRAFRSSACGRHGFSQGAFLQQGRGLKSLYQVVGLVNLVDVCWFY